jgi:GT2 family glycosyltransferase
MKIFAVVVTYNGSQWIKKCLNSLVNSSLKLDILVIDNNSNDKTLEIIRENFTQIKVFNLNKNLGFGKANNIGIRYAIENNADYIFLLNQDAWIEKDVIEILVNNAEKNPDYAILSPMQYYNRNTLDYKFKNYFKNGVLNKNGIVDVHFVNAAIWLVRANSFKAHGMFHECFTHYGEDQELCLRYTKKNEKIGIIKIAIGFHDRPQKEKLITKESIYKQSQIRLLIRLCSMEINFIRGFLSLIKYLISKRSNFDDKYVFLYRINVLFKSLPIYCRNRNKHYLWHRKNQRETKKKQLYKENLNNLRIEIKKH